MIPYKPWKKNKSKLEIILGRLGKLSSGYCFHRKGNLLLMVPVKGYEQTWDGKRAAEEIAAVDVRNMSGPRRLND